MSNTIPASVMNLNGSSTINQQTRALSDSFARADEKGNEAFERYTKAVASGNEAEMFSAQRDMQKWDRIKSAMQELLRNIHQNVMELVRNLRVS